MEKLVLPSSNKSYKHILDLQGALMIHIIICVCVSVCVGYIYNLFIYI